MIAAGEIGDIRCPNPPRSGHGLFRPAWYAAVEHAAYSLPMIEIFGVPDGSAAAGGEDVVSFAVVRLDDRRIGASDQHTRRRRSIRRQGRK